MSNLLKWFIENQEEILIGLSSAMLFLIIVFVLFRPWFYISRKISYDGTAYRFKVINFTLIKCTDVNIYLRQVTERDAFPKGKDVEYIMLDVSTDRWVYISGVFGGIFNVDRPNCIQNKVTKHDLRKIIEDDGTSLELIMSARHGISNLQKTKKRAFRHVKYVVDGKFESGFTCKVAK